MASTEPNGSYSKSMTKWQKPCKPEKLIRHGLTRHRLIRGGASAIISTVPNRVCNHVRNLCCHGYAEHCGRGCKPRPADHRSIKTDSYDLCPDAICKIAVQYFLSIASEIADTRTSWQRPSPPVPASDKTRLSNCFPPPGKGSDHSPLS